MNHAPDPLFLAELAATKLKILASKSNLKLHAVNGMVPASVVEAEIEKAAAWAARFGNPAN